MSEVKESRLHETAARWPWIARLAWALWLFLEAVFFQGMVASYQEMEPRAAIIFGGIFITFLLGGIIVWVVRREHLI